MSIKQSLANVGSDLVSMIRTRIALFGLELNIETSRVFGLLFLVCAAMVCALLAVLFASLLIATYFWDTPYRLLAIGLLAVGYALAALVVVWILCSKMKSEAGPFHATLQELERDVQMLARISQKNAAQTGEDASSYPDRKDVW